MSKVTFSEMNIDSKVLQSLDDMGFVHPTEIQEVAIPLLSSTDKDFVGQAQTGTGKTAAFVIPLLQKIDYKKKGVQALILAPTRELAVQVENEIGKLGKHTGVRSICIYGGTGYEKQVRSLKRENPHIAVGTPGRVIDLINKGILKLDTASFCVLDEADEMLNMGFFEDVQTILDLFNAKRQLVMFSATMPRQILSLIKKSFNDYELVQIKNKSLSNDDIEQKYFVVRDRHHKEALARLIDNAPDIYALVFCRTRIETREVGDDLKKRGYSVEVLHGEMSQNERDHSMRKFKDKTVTIMVCTDVAARGIDVINLTHVFNYGLPQDNESYVHRTGRTGRAGMKGKAFTIVGPKAVFALRRIEKHINKKIDFAKLPSVKELKNKIVSKELESAVQILEAIQLKGDEFKSDEAFEMFEGQFKDMEKDELLKLMFTWKFNKILRHYNNLSDIESISNDRSGGGRSRSGGSSARGPRGSRGGSGGGSRSRGNFRGSRSESGGSAGGRSRSSNSKSRSTGRHH